MIGAVERDFEEGDRAGGLKFDMHELTRGLIESQIAGAPSQSSWSSRSGVGLGSLRF